MYDIYNVTALFVSRLWRCGAGFSLWRCCSSAHDRQNLRVKSICNVDPIQRFQRFRINVLMCIFYHPAGRCNNARAADIVFLVDGSSSIGRPNFLQVKGFMAGIVKPFASSVSQSGIRFGAIQYSDTSRWLNIKINITSLICTPLHFTWSAEFIYFCLRPGLNLPSLPTWTALSWSMPYRI